MSVGTKLRKLRLQNRWSQEELAYKLNVAQTSVSNFEANKSIPDFLIMQKICEIFSVGFEYFIEDNQAINNVENAENCNIGCNTGIVNTMPEGILEKIMYRLDKLEIFLLDFDKG
jgi:transcriptional regulator with XRE-family HTH domain